jgi:hypothetical protein
MTNKKDTLEYHAEYGTIDIGQERLNQLGYKQVNSLLFSKKL